MNENLLLNKEKCIIYLYEKASAIRQMYIDTFIQLGFKCIVPFSDILMLNNKLKVEHADWCILSLDGLRNLNLSELLESTFNVSKNDKLLISIINEMSDENILPVLYENGIFCNFVKSYTIEPFEEQIADLLKYIQIYKGDYTLVSSEYIRMFLKQRKLYKTLLRLEEAIQENYLCAPNCLLKLAEALCLNEKYNQAAGTLSQAEFIEPKMKFIGNTLRKKYLKLNQGEEETNAKNILGIKNCIIIDNDTEVQFFLSENLKKLGIPECQNFEDGEAAYQYFKQSMEPKLILMEWKIPSISGLALVQRIRKIGFNQCLIIIISSLLKKSDLPLLEEVGIDDVLEKPFDSTQLSKALLSAVYHARKPTEQRSFERKIRFLLSNKQFGEAERMIQEFLNNKQISEGSKLHIKAEYDYVNQKYESAIKNALASLRISVESIMLLTLLGKCFLQLKDIKNALSSFQQAHDLSPYNLDRILNLISLNIEDGNLENADHLIKKAKEIDSSRLDVMEMECRVAVEKSDLQTATNILEALDSLTGFIGMINNDAVTRIHTGKYEEGLELYKKALKSIPKKFSETKVIVTYNLALAYARYGELDKSLETLNSVNASSNFKIYTKYSSLLKKVKHCIETSTKLELQENNEKFVFSDISNSKSIDDIFQEAVNKSKVKKGTRCCYKIFINSQLE